MLKPCPFLLYIYIDTPLMNNSQYIFFHDKINIPRVVIKVNHLHGLVDPENASKTMYKIIQYISFCKIHNIPKYEVTLCLSFPNIL